MGKRIVITGANGLVGSHFLERYAEEDELYAVVRPGKVQNEKKLIYKEVGADLERYGALSEACLPGQCDSVIYLAQSAGYRNLPEAASSLLQVNLVALAEALEYAKRSGASSFVYASTGSLYLPSSDVLTENSPIISAGEGAAFYPWSKLTGEQLVRSYEANFSVSILRCFFMYGKGGDSAMLIPRMASKVASGERIQLSGGDGMVFPVLHAGDAAEAFRAAVDLQGRNTINVAGSNSISLRFLCEELGRHMGDGSEIEAVEGTAPFFGVDVSQMREKLGVQPIPFEDGVKLAFPAE